MAVVDQSGRSLTYRQLDELSDRVAGFLRARGVRPGDRVGAIAPKSPEVVATLFGIMKAGAAYVPADYTAPAARNRTLLADCAVKAVFLDPSCVDVCREWPGALRPLVVWMSSEEIAPEDGGVNWETVAANAPSIDDACASSEGLAYILYTSGSTGVPKGVMLTHGNAVSFVDWSVQEFAATEHDRFSSHAPFHFDLSIFDLYVPIATGAALYLVSEAVGKSPQDLAAFVSDNRLTVWYSTPSILSLLAQFGSLDRRDCSSLRTVLFAGEVFPIKHLRSIVEHWPQAEFFNLYGPTETNVCTFARIPRTIPADRTEPYPIGHVCPYCESTVLDSPAGADVGAGEEGLLHIAGASLFQGYWNRPTNELFFERDGRRWYNTGDVVREAPGDGYIYVGRRDRMVKRRGYRIELGEIERGLYQNERVREAAAIAVPDSATGVRIVAFVSAQPGAQPSVIELKTFCGQALPSYMNPDAFVFLPALPRTSTDKVDYQGLLRLHEERRTTVAPRNT
jgi:amino acid adenylation domain-containing protein